MPRTARVTHALPCGAIAEGAFLHGSPRFSAWLLSWIKFRRPATGDRSRARLRDHEVPFQTDKPGVGAPKLLSEPLAGQRYAKVRRAPIAASIMASECRSIFAATLIALKAAAII